MKTDPIENTVKNKSLFSTLRFSFLNQQLFISCATDENKQLEDISKYNPFEQLWSGDVLLLSQWI